MKCLSWNDISWTRKRYIVNSGFELFYHMHKYPFNVLVYDIDQGTPQLLDFCFCLVKCASEREFLFQG